MSTAVWPTEGCLSKEARRLCLCAASNSSLLHILRSDQNQTTVCPKIQGYFVSHDVPPPRDALLYLPCSSFQILNASCSQGFSTDFQSPRMAGFLFCLPLCTVFSSLPRQAAKLSLERVNFLFLYVFSN